MYPFIRMIKDLVKFRNAPALGMLDTHVSSHRCWPWDLDFWMELNNGRTLTLYDIGRVTLGQRTGLLKVLAHRKWGLTVAGSSARYRKRVRMFQKFEMRSRLSGWDEKFMYLEQSMWREGECTSHVLIRAAVTDANGLIGTTEVTKALGMDPVSPRLPDWILAWCNAEGQRTWPPMLDVDPHLEAVG